ncbi:YggT family protein [Azospirillum sp. SYSU D00513]|uniref:YggT family protein n=1 Tax=Azospirillum sp. SYSU D00513 TaxID=2812561 RepID=UPI001A9725DE|nr:YggT family protein [Azospirillum sp. SYSU D00513]
MEPLVSALLILVLTILDLFWWILIIQVVMSWLIAFNVINTRNRFIYMIGDFADRVTEPVLRPIRSVLPNFGGIDLSPLVVLLLLGFVQNLIAGYAMQIRGGF